MPRRQVIPAFLSLLLLMPGWPHAAEGVALPGLDGGRLTDRDLEKGPVVLVVWASWSPRCRDIVPRVNALERKWSSKATVATVVFQEDPDDVRKFLSSRDLRVPVYLDQSGAFSKKHTVTTLPGLLIFKNGQADFRGRLPANPDAVLEKMLG